MKKPTDTTLKISTDYRQFIEELKARVTAARITAAQAITHEAILLYWDIGRGIVEKQMMLGWGESVIEQVSMDLQAAFPGSTGYSPRNLRSARQLYLTYCDPAIWLQPVAKLNVDTVIPFLRQLVAEIPWGQNLLILNKLSSPAARLWYLRATARFGWSRNVLLNQIKASAYETISVEWTHRHYVQDNEYIAAFLKREIAKPIIRWEETKKDGKTILGYEILPNKYFYRYQPPTPAKDLLAEFWKLEKEAEKMLEGLANK